jgi:hypothetical protein
MIVDGAYIAGDHHTFGVYLEMTLIAGRRTR